MTWLKVKWDWSKLKLRGAVKQSTNYKLLTQ